MEVLNKDHGADDASVVSGSTNMTDVTQNLQVPDLGRHPDCYKMQAETSNMSLQTEDGVSNTDRCELSPVVPVQLTAFTQNWQKSPSVDGTASEMSQPLIPVISKNSSTLEGKKAYLELQSVSQSVEASQSLLPQIPMEVSMTENNQESVDQAKHLSQPLKRASCRDGPSGQSQGAVTLSQPEVGMSHSQRAVTLSQPEVGMSQSQRAVTLSQPEVGMSQSQGAVTFTQREKDPVDRIISRLDRLVSSLDKVPRRQMMVMEATVLQCITSLQDSLNNKLKKRASASDTTGIVRRVLHTTQNGLLKLTELHKLEKSQLSQTGIQSTHKVAQSNVNDLAKRQRRVFDLLKRQKYLVEYYKTGKRPIPDNSMKEVTSSQHCGAATSKDYERGKHRDIRIKHSQNLGRTRKGKNLEPITATVANETTVTVNTYKSSTGKRMEKSVKEISKSEINREVNKCPFPGEKAPSSDIKRITTEADKLDTDNSGGGCENAVVSQDVTTIPDTQELGCTQESGRVSIQDTFGDREDSTIDRACENGFPIDDADTKETEEVMTVKKADAKTDVETHANDYCSKHKDEANTNMEMEISNERGDSKQEMGETVDRYEAVKKARLDGEIINAESGKSTKNAKDHTELTEVLWLNMLREDTKVKCSQGKATTKGQELLTATKLNEEPGSSIEPDVGVCRSEFPFAKPNILRQLDADKYTALPEAPKQDRTSFSHRSDNANLSKKTNTVSDTEFKGKRSDKIDRQEITIGNQKNNQVIQGLSSPPAATYQAETWHNVSPTATSMSSDVFVVKMKDLERRMKNRTLLSNKTQENKQSNSNERAYVQQVRNPGNDEVMEDMNRDDKDFGNDCGEKVKVSDTISDCIASVIKQSRDFATRKDGASRLGKVFENSARINPACQETNQLNIPEKRCDVWTKPLLPAAQPKSLSVNDRGSSQKACKGFNARLPTLRDLIHSGQITHGKGVLSCFLKGKTQRASLTPLGKIRTEEGLVLTTASQWVSTLTDGAPVKKRKAYEMVLYKGRQLVSFCRATLVASSSHIKPVTIVKLVQPSGSITSADQSTQVNDAEITQQSKKMTDDEQRLNSLLSSCVVRLLTEHDFVSCDDLPENFWTDDFSKVRLHKDIWDNVDAW